MRYSNKFLLDLPFNQQSIIQERNKNCKGLAKTFSSKPKDQ